MTDAFVMFFFVVALILLGGYGYAGSASGLYAFDQTRIQITVILSILPAVIAAHRWSPGRVGTVVFGLTLTLLFNVGLAVDQTTVVLLILPALVVYYLAMVCSLRRREAKNSEKWSEALRAITAMVGHGRSIQQFAGTLEAQVAQVLGNVDVQVWVVDPAHNEIRLLAYEHFGNPDANGPASFPIYLQQNGIISMGDSGPRGRNRTRVHGRSADQTVVPISDQDVLGGAIRDRRSLQLPDISKVSSASYPLREESIQNGVHRVMIQPLVATSQTVGLLIIACGIDRPRGFSTSEQEFVSDAAAVTVLALRGESTFSG